MKEPSTFFCRAKNGPLSALSGKLPVCLNRNISFKSCITLLFVFNISQNAIGQSASTDFFSKPFSVKYEEGIAKQIDSGIDLFLTRYTDRIISQRKKFWNRQFGSPGAYSISVDPNRNDLRKMIGATDTVNNIRLVTMGRADKANPGKTSIVGRTAKAIIYQVKWTVVKGLTSEGLLLVPRGKIKASAVVIPDADEVPEEYAGLKPGPSIALSLTENGVRVLIPVMISRDTKYSGSDSLYPSRRHWMKGMHEDFQSKWSNETSREWIWRQSFVMGHGPVGMGVQKILAAVDWLQKNDPAGNSGKIGVMGYGTGGLLAMYAAAIDTRIDAVWVSGYFGPRKDLWREPVSRDIWGLLNEFGDAEIASMIVPRSLIIENAPVPRVKLPKPVKKGQRNYALPGELKTPSKASVRKEVNRLKQFFPDGSSVHPDITLFEDVARHGTQKALQVFADRLGIDIALKTRPNLSVTRQHTIDMEKRQERVFDNMVGYIQNMIPTAAHRRAVFFKGDYSSPEAWERSMEPYRKYFYNEIIGKIDEGLLPMNAKMRLVYDEPEWKGYEVVLNVWPDVYAWGILAVPKGLKPGEKRPAVVMQHGIHGLPTTSILVGNYHRVLPELAKKGFVVFAPYNPYQFNIRKAHAVKANAFSVIIPQYQQILNFLKSKKYVDSTRIGLYGKSWGGRTAMNITAVLKDFKVAVNVGYYNEWLKKTVSTDYAHSYFYENSLSIYNWNMGNTMLHAEISDLIIPRPYLIVAGLNDAVARPEDVAAEFEKVKLVYDILGIGDRAAIDFWQGAHEIDIKGGGIPFLEKFLMHHK